MNDDLIITGGTVIDGTGKLVPPGFVDLHAHLDAQVGWDPELRPSSYHSVTTALIGNCGVTFAPVSEANRLYLAELMEAVEDSEYNGPFPMSCQAGVPKAPRHRQ